MASRSIWKLRLALLPVAVVAGVGLAWLQHRREAAATPAPAAGTMEIVAETPRTVAPFALTDTDGSTLTLDTLRGKVWIAHLFFATCESICPRLVDNLARVQADVGDAGRFDIVSVSVDPEHDTPAALAAYAAARRADTNRWHFVTAPTPVVHALASENLRVGPGDDPAGHAPYVVLVDREARIVDYYDGLDAAALRRLTDDLKRLVAP